MAEDYYITAFNEMSDMLAGRDSLSIKRAVYFAEWAYYEDINLIHTTLKLFQRMISRGIINLCQKF